MKAMLISLLVLSGLAVASSAQEQDRPQRFVWYPRYLDLLVHDDVQKKLGLDDEQARVVAALKEDWEAAYERIREQEADVTEQIRAEREAAAQPYETKARGLLSDEQFEALEDIRFEGRLDFFSPLRKLRRPELQAELQLDDAQKEAIEKLHGEWRKSCQPLKLLHQQIPPEGFQDSEFVRTILKREREFHPRVRTLCEAVFSQDQLDRQQQIEWQATFAYEGIRTFLRTEVAQYLNLNAEQQNQIRKEIKTDKADASSSEEFIARRDAFRRCQELLTPAQRRLFDALVGKPFDPMYRWMLGLPTRAGQESQAASEERPS